jgi:hypothetical protein
MSENFTFDHRQESFLLRLARGTAQSYLDKKPIPNFNAEARSMGLNIGCGGVFVTYYNNGAGAVFHFFLFLMLHWIV